MNGGKGGYKHGPPESCPEAASRSGEIGPPGMPLPKEVLRDPSPAPPESDFWHGSGLTGVPGGVSDGDPIVPRLEEIIENLIEP